MAVKASGYDRLIALESELKEVSDTSLRLFYLKDLHRRFNTLQSTQLLRSLKKPI